MMNTSNCNSSCACFKAFDLEVTEIKYCTVIFGCTGLVFLALVVTVIVLAYMRCKLMRKLGRLEVQFNNYSPTVLDEAKNDICTEDERHPSSPSKRLDESAIIEEKNHFNYQNTSENQTELVYTKPRKATKKSRVKGSENILLSTKNLPVIEKTQKDLKSSAEVVYDEINEKKISNVNSNYKSNADSNSDCADEAQLAKLDQNYTSAADLIPPTNTKEKSEIKEEDNETYDSLFSRSKSRKLTAQLNYEVVAHPEIPKLKSKKHDESKINENENKSNYKNKPHEQNSYYDEVESNFDEKISDNSSDVERDSSEDFSENNNALSHLSLPPPPLPPPYEGSDEETDALQANVYDIAADM